MVATVTEKTVTRTINPPNGLQKLLCCITQREREDTISLQVFSEMPQNAVGLGLITEVTVTRDAEQKCTFAPKSTLPVFQPDAPRELGPSFFDAPTNLFRCFWKKRHDEMFVSRLCGKRMYAAVS